MKYKNFLIDLDDTLLNFQESEILCLNSTLSHFGISSIKNEFFKEYKIINDELWKQLELGNVEKDFLKIERWRKTLKIFNLTISPEEISNFYLEQLPLNVVLNDHAVELCAFLKKHGTIAIITNGILAIQHQRINNSKLKDYIDIICVSEECGFAKPDARFFDFTLNKIANAKKEETIIIGDRLEADIKGGELFGIDSLWFNHEKINNKTNIKPTFEVHYLKQIIELLKN